MSNVHVFKSKYDRAVKLYTKILVFQHKFLCANHRLIADALSDLSLAHEWKENTAELWKFSIKAIRIKTQL